jgi:DNA-binding PadR family transcriptional regulator
VRTDAALTLNGWAVLGVLAVDGPAHGFAVAKALAPGGEVGRVWTVSRAQVYRTLAQLEAAGLCVEAGTEPGSAGPRRTPFRITPKGRRAVRTWLRRPVEHLRDVRTELLLKVVLSERAGLDVDKLLRAQQEHFRPAVAALARGAARAEGTDRVVATWRYESSRAVERTLAALQRGPRS